MPQILYTHWMESHGYLLIAEHPYAFAMLVTFFGAVMVAIGVSMGIGAWSVPGPSKLNPKGVGRSRFSLHQIIPENFASKRMSQ
jgi:hypothetical protein